MGDEVHHAIVDYFSESHHPRQLPVFRVLCNALKAALIDYGLKLWESAVHTPRLQVLDIGCGRGGDLWKWTKNRPKTFVGVDASSACVEEARARFAALISRGRSNMSASFYVCDARTQRLPVEDESVDIVSCQFAMQFFFDAAEHQEHFFREVWRCLKPQGLLLAVLPDGNRVHRLLQCGEALLGHFRVTPTERTDLQRAPPVGIEYTFALTEAFSCNEFIVSPTYLQKTAASQGFVPALPNGAFCWEAQAFLSSSDSRASVQASVQAVLKDRSCSVQDWRSLALFMVVACRKPGAAPVDGTGGAEAAPEIVNPLPRRPRRSVRLPKCLPPGPPPPPP
jgi:ubiquinone/menaquinone biosynthesis C-methylase UbiE